MENNNFHNHDPNRQNNDRRVAEGPGQLRHMGEIHSIPAHKESQGEEYCRDHSQQVHGLGLAVIDLGQVHLPDLQRVVSEHFHMASQQLNTAGKMLEQHAVVWLKHVVCVGTDGRGQIHQLRIIGVERHQILPVGEKALIEGFGDLVQQLIFQRRKMAFAGLDEAEVVVKPGVEQIAEKAGHAEVTRKLIFPHTAHHVDELLLFSDEVQPVFRDIKSELMAAADPLMLDGQGERTKNAGAVQLNLTVDNLACVPQQRPLVGNTVHFCLKFFHREENDLLRRFAGARIRVTFAKHRVQRVYSHSIPS